MRRVDPRWARAGRIAERRLAETTLPIVTLDPAMAAALRSAGNKVREWTERRDELIRTAVEAGGSYREVGTACGLSHTAVKFIAKGRP